MSETGRASRILDDLCISVGNVEEMKTVIQSIQEQGYMYWWPILLVHTIPKHVSYFFVPILPLKHPLFLDEIKKITQNETKLIYALQLFSSFLKATVEIFCIQTQSRPVSNSQMTD